MIAGSHNRSRVIGLLGAGLDCQACDLSGPNLGEELKAERNCKRAGANFGDPRPELNYQIDFTGNDQRDNCNFCPASVASSEVKRSIQRIFDLERLAASFGKPTARPALHWPLRTKSRALAILAARDRFTAEEEAAITEVNKPLAGR